MNKSIEPSTLCVHRLSRAPGQPVIPPIDLGTVYEQGNAVGYDEIVYPRFGTLPIQAALNAKLAALEGAGAAVACGSGVSAISAVLWSNLRAGDHVIASAHRYGGTGEILDGLTRFGVQVSTLTEITEDSLKAALTEQSRIILTESISNPLTRVIDHEAVVRCAERFRLLAIVDNTIATPLRFQPLKLGYHGVVHSASKFLSGHSDLVAGALMGNKEFVRRAFLHLRTHGGILAPFECYLLDRGIKTLHLRVRAQSANAQVLARRLAGLSKM